VINSEKKISLKTLLKTRFYKKKLKTYVNVNKNVFFALFLHAFDVAPID